MPKIHSSPKKRTAKNHNLPRVVIEKDHGATVQYQG